MLLRPTAGRRALDPKIVVRIHEEQPPPQETPMPNKMLKMSVKSGQKPVKAAKKATKPTKPVKPTTMGY